LQQQRLHAGQHEEVAVDAAVSQALVGIVAVAEQIAALVAATGSTRSRGSSGGIGRSGGLMMYST
jgi:hypothetical protein